MFNRTILQALLGVALLGSPLEASTQAAGSFAGNGDYVVIVNASNPISALTREQISRLFLKKAQWAAGRPVQPVDQSAASPVRVAFSKEIHGRSVSAVKAYWRQLVFSGAEVPPIECPTDDDVVAYVANNPDAIGYARAGAVMTSSVKIVAVAR